MGIKIYFTLIAIKKFMSGFKSWLDDTYVALDNT